MCSSLYSILLILFIDRHIAKGVVDTALLNCCPVRNARCAVKIIVLFDHHALCVFINCPIAQASDPAWQSRLYSPISAEERYINSIQYKSISRKRQGMYTVSYQLNKKSKTIGKGYFFSSKIVTVRSLRCHHWNKTKNIKLLNY